MSLVLYCIESASVDIYANEYEPKNDYFYRQYILEHIYHWQEHNDVLHGAYKYVYRNSDTFNWRDLAHIDGFKSYDSTKKITSTAGVVVRYSVYICKRSFDICFTSHSRSNLWRTH